MTKNGWVLTVGWAIIAVVVAFLFGATTGSSSISAAESGKPAGILNTSYNLIIEADSFNCKMPANDRIWMECIYTMERTKELGFHRIEIRRRVIR